MSGYGFSVGSSGYDDEDRLVNWERTDTNLDQSWNLSAVGNWNSITENTSPQNRTHDPTHEILTVASQSVTHDAKGNMTLIPAVLRPTNSGLPPTASRLTWDFENKLIAADTDNDSMDDIFYKFDALGQRVGRDDGTANVVYFQDGQQTVADYPSGTAAGSPTYTYVYASYIDEPVMRGGSGGLRYYHRNQQYSITAVSDGGGSVVERYAYSAYGQATIADASGSLISSSAIANRYTYTGREWDEGLNLYHYRARMYDAVGGRFVSRDPIGYEGSTNFYSGTLFANGWLDPQGLRFEVDTIYRTVPEIRLDSGRPGTLMSTRPLQAEFVGENSVFVEKKPGCDNCYCAYVSKNKVKQPLVRLRVLIPRPEDSVAYVTEQGWYEAVDHEMARVGYHRKGYNTYLAGAVGRFNDCDGLCRKSREEARRMLLIWLGGFQASAVNQHLRYVIEETVGVDQENRRDWQLPYDNGRFNGYKRRYKGLVPPPLVVPKCYLSTC